MEATQIWQERYDRKKNVQSSGRLCFSAGSNYNRKKIRPEKKVQSSRLTGCFFRHVQITTRKITTGKIKGTVVWPMEAAQIWGECYDRKKKRTVVWPAMFFRGFKLHPEKITTGKKKIQSSRLTGRFFRRIHITTRRKFDQKNKRYSRLADGGGSDLAGT